ncbi:MAG: hypothetical protein ACFCVD_23590 [Nodosilinea sp.]
MVTTLVQRLHATIEDEQRVCFWLGEYHLVSKSESGFSRIVGIYQFELLL